MPLHPEFERAYTADFSQLTSIALLPFVDGRLVCSSGPGATSLIKTMVYPTPEIELFTPLVLGSLNGVTYVTDNAIAAGDEFAKLELRELYGELPMQEWLIAGYAFQLLHWRQTSQYCPRCGAGMSALGHEWQRKCSSCGMERYPQISPALLILVHDGSRILMAHKPGWGPRYSIFAGFVLPGESLEECVHREVAEEFGVLIGELEYAGSQPWPFPHQLMIGFRARYLGGEVAIDKDELDDARWFSADDMPSLPGELSLSRQMIESWLKNVV